MRTALACYSLAVLAVLATALLKCPIEAHVGHGPPFILFLPAVTLGAWYGGLGSGLLATILATIICAFCFIPLSDRSPSTVATTCSGWSSSCWKERSASHAFRGVHRMFR